MFSTFKNSPLSQKFFAIGLSFFLGSCSEEASPDLNFDFSHVDFAIQYFEASSENLIVEIAATDAARHLKNHSDRTGYYAPDATTEDITRDLMKDIPSSQALQEVRALVTYAKESPERQKACLEEAEKYLPKEAMLKNPLYITWGYDIGVAMGDRASLNLTHRHFLADPEEIWFYCTHEAHHSGLMQLHPFTKISAIETTRELYEFVRYATFLEGLAVYSAWEARRQAGALENDRDYANLENPEKLASIMTTYWQNLSDLEGDLNNPLGDEHWQVVEEMSSGDRLWYVAGALMAKSIEDALGRDSLIEIIGQGPEAFFETYGKIQK